MARIELGQRDEIFSVSADDIGVFIACGWTVAISPPDALRYAKAGLSSNANAGFFLSGNVSPRVILTHKDCKIAMSHDDARKIMDLIKTVYDAPMDEPSYS
jgi:hypothetical protein